MPSCFGRVQLCATQWTVACLAPVLGDSLGNTGVGCQALLQIFPTQGSNWHLLHCRWIFYLLSPQGTREARDNGNISKEEWPLLGRNIQTCNNETFLLWQALTIGIHICQQERNGGEFFILSLYWGLQFATVSFDPNFFERNEIQKALLWMATCKQHTIFSIMFYLLTVIAPQEYWNSVSFLFRNLGLPIYLPISSMKLPLFGISICCNLCAVLSHSVVSDSLQCHGL